jgi:hypothetical protein
MSKKLHKLKRPIDYISQDPIRALKEVFDEVNLDYILDELPFWFYMALSSKWSEYKHGKQRRNFIEFYHELTYFIEAMYFFNKSKNTDEVKQIDELPDQTKDFIYKNNLPRNLSEAQTANPLPLIRTFCRIYPLTYIRIELWHFLIAGGTYQGRFTENIFKENVYNYYLNLLCLVEVGYILTKKQHK